MQRISRDALTFIGTKGIVERLPCGCDDSPTVLVIKAPKTASSIRTVFLPDQFAAQLLDYKSQIKCETNAPVFHLQNGKVRLCAVFPLIKTIIYVSISYIDGIFNNNL